MQTLGNPKAKGKHKNLKKSIRLRNIVQENWLKRTPRNTLIVVRKAKPYPRLIFQLNPPYNDQVHPPKHLNFKFKFFAAFTSSNTNKSEFDYLVDEQQNNEDKENCFSISSDISFELTCKDKKKEDTFDR